jgi:hypothetical protein
MGVFIVTLVPLPIDRITCHLKAFCEWWKRHRSPTMDHMNLRVTLVVLLSLCCGQATLTASTSYFTFGTTQPFDLYNGTSLSAAGVWHEVIGPGVTTQSIDCVNALTNITKVCGNPGPDSSVNINFPSAPGNQGIVPPNTVVGQTTNYLLVDGDDNYGAPVWTQMSGLTAGVTYSITFDQASTEETGNSQADTDTWQVYGISGTTAKYICPTCSTPVLDAAQLIFTADPMLNPAGGTTNWEQETFTFVASAANEVLEFVTNAIITPPGTGAVDPPILLLAGVTNPSVATPEPGTWVLTVVGAGLVFAATRLRRRTSPEFKRVMEAHVNVKQ